MPDPNRPILVMLIVAALLAAAAVIRRSRRRRRLAGWVHTTGEVVAEEGVLNTRASTRSFLPVVRFTTPDGRVVEATARSGTYAGISRIGRSINVAHDPDDPSRFDAWIGRDRTGSLLGGIAAGLVALALLAQL